MNTATTAFHPEHWLILSPAVFDSIAAERGGTPDTADLLQLRLDSRLVESCEMDHVGARARNLYDAGCRTIHLVVENLDAQVMLSLQGLRDALPAGLDIQLHDWYESPSDVLVSLSAPDQAVVDRLRTLRQTPAGAALAPAALPGQPRFWNRYRQAMQSWESAARKEYGGYFNEFYTPDKIPWQVLIPSDRGWYRILGLLKKKAQDAVADTLHIGDALVKGVLPYAPSGPATRPIAPNYAAGLGVVSAASAGGQAIEWEFREGDVEVNVTITFVDDRATSQRRCDIAAYWSGGSEKIEPPGHVKLFFFDEPGFSIPVDDGRWVTEFGPKERKFGSVSISDPVWALRTLLSMFYEQGREPALNVRAD